MRRRLAEHSGLLQLALLAAIALLFATLVVRSILIASTDRQLCDVLHDLVARSGATVGQPGSSGYAYFKAHPQELRIARAQNAEFLRQLNCAHLPSAGGRP